MYDNTVNAITINDVNTIEYTHEDKLQSIYTLNIFFNLLF